MFWVLHLGCSGSRPPCTQTNGRRCQAAAGPRGDLQDSLQHEAVANFLQLAWKDVCFKLEQSQQAAHEGKREFELSDFLFEKDLHNNVDAAQHPF